MNITDSQVSLPTLKRIRVTNDDNNNNTSNSLFKVDSVRLDMPLPELFDMSFLDMPNIDFCSKESTITNDNEYIMVEDQVDDDLQGGGSVFEEILDFFIDPTNPTKVLLSRSSGASTTLPLVSSPSSSIEYFNSTTIFDGLASPSSASSSHSSSFTTFSPSHSNCSLPLDLITTNTANTFYNSYLPPNLDCRKRTAVISTAPTSAPPPAMVKRRNEEDKVQLKRERNRQAAERCRTRRNNLISNLQFECEQLRVERDRLQGENRMLMEALAGYGHHSVLPNPTEYKQ